ncbi:hypothetical protein J4727_06905 [Providencia rettgeri]|uniref:Uncharacterized protein n=1 Tax=Providencia rettgeri TaxID=587 RepID=A0A939NAH0_PRORE|nr:hypothetical protein [Providencia rettgeri]
MALSVGLAAYGAKSVVATATLQHLRGIDYYRCHPIRIGMAVYNYFKTDAFEELLKQCFWGNGDKYFAGI